MTTAEARVLEVPDRALSAAMLIAVTVAASVGCGSPPAGRTAADAIAELTLQRCVTPQPQAGSTTYMIEGHAVTVNAQQDASDPRHVHFHCAVGGASDLVVSRPMLMLRLLRALGPPTLLYSAELGGLAEGGVAARNRWTVLPLDDQGSRLDLQESSSSLALTFDYYGPSDSFPLQYFAARRLLPGFASALAAQFQPVMEQMARIAEANGRVLADSERQAAIERAAREVREAQEEAQRAASEAANRATIMGAIGRIATPMPTTYGPPAVSITTNVIPSADVEEGHDGDENGGGTVVQENTCPPSPQRPELSCCPNGRGPDGCLIWECFEHVPGQVSVCSR